MANELRYRYHIVYTYQSDKTQGDIRGTFVYSTNINYLNEESLEYIDGYITDCIFKKYSYYPTFIVIDSISFIGCTTDKQFYKAK